MSITGSISTDLISLCITLLVLLFAYVKWKYQYWERKNLQYLEPKIPFGNFFGPEHPGIQLKRFYDVMKSKTWKHGGIYGLLSPIYVPVDLEYVKNILTRDFQYFSDRGLYYNEKGDPLTAHLFAMAGSKWRNLRAKLTPTFTSGKMKLMFSTILECEVNLQKKLKMEFEKKAPIDIKELLGCFTTDIIGSCAFGLDCKSFEEENSPFRSYGKRAFERDLVERLRRVFANTFPEISKKLNFTVLPKDLSNFFMKIVKDTVDYREENNINRKDFMQLLIDLKNNKLDGAENSTSGTNFSIDEIAAQSFLFFVAGFETSSTTMSFTLYELARHQGIQERVRKEIQTVLKKYNGNITYESIQEMKYLGQVIDEALRIYPPASFIFRKCVKDYKVPETDVTVEKGTTVLIPILGIHKDEEYYPNPEEFDPERFNEEKKNSRPSYSHIPFGEGPRICIGMRFGLMQSKVGLVSLLRNFKFTVNNKTREPLKMKKNSLALAAEGEIWLDAHKI